MSVKLCEDFRHYMRVLNSMRGHGGCDLTHRVLHEIKRSLACIKRCATFLALKSFFSSNGMQEF